METLAQLIKQRQELHTLSGIVTVLLRSCPYQHTVLGQQTRILPNDGVAITAKRNLDRACLEVATGIQAYLHDWDHFRQQKGTLPQEERGNSNE
jgi:hypothetical protein